MNKYKYLLYIFFACCVLYVLGATFLFFPIDILYTFPQYKEQTGFQIPHNSLLADPVVQFEPWRNYSKERIIHFELPFINDKNALGVPFLANPQVALFYPLSFIYYLLPVGPALFLIHIGKVLLFAAFSYMYFRSINVVKPLSLFGSYLVVSSAFFLMWLMWPHTNVYLFFPLFLYLVEKIRVNTRNMYRYYVGLSIGFLFAILGGHPETLFSVGVITFFYAFVRLFSSKEKFVKTCMFILLGFLLASFQLLPFVEYLFNSHMLFSRLTVQHESNLPLLGIPFLFIPYFLGGPHLSLYKPIPGTNFQELLGGYVGIAVILLGVFSIVKTQKNSLNLFWIALAIITFGLSYGIFPFTLLETLPIVNVSANQRLSAFFGFSLIVVSVYYLHSIVVNNQNKFPLTAKKGFLFFGMSFVGMAVLYIFFPFTFLLLQNPQLTSFISLLSFHIIQIALSVCLFFIFLFSYLRTKRTVFLFLTVAAFSFQSFALFANYNTITTEEYYRKTPLIEILQNLPTGVYLEVGNSAIPENVNLMYGLSSIENYDALEIRQFRETFDSAFPKKNHWGNIDEVTYESLRLFGITYVISDYDIRKRKRDIYPTKSEVLSKVIPGSDIVFSFKTYDSISELRLLPATFNRQNDCTILMRIQDETDKIISAERIMCSAFTNNNFYTFPISNAPLEPGEYRVTIMSPDATSENSISFFGYRSVPYIAGLIAEDMGYGNFKLLARGESWYLFQIAGSLPIETDGAANIISETSDEVSLIHRSNKDEVLEIKRANYPGWSVSIDNKSAMLLDSPFLKVKVPQGEHTIKYSYIPYSFILGTALTLLSGIFLIIYIIKKK